MKKSQKIVALTSVIGLAVSIIIILWKENNWIFPITNYTVIGMLLLIVSMLIIVKSVLVSPNQDN